MDNDNQSHGSQFSTPVPPPLPNETPSSYYGTPGAEPLGTTPPGATFFGQQPVGATPPPSYFERPTSRSNARRNLLIALVLVVAFALVITAGALVVLGFSDDSKSPGPVVSAGPSVSATKADANTLQEYINQKITWTPCEKGKCTKITVPLDYANPAGKKIQLFLRMVPADGPSQGVIFVNPGGPGGSGAELAKRFDRKGLEKYDIVGWDPRGTAQSEGLQCMTDAEADKYMQLDSSPDNEKERQELVAGMRKFAESCLAKYPDLARHISTQDTVADLDLMRQIFKQPKLNYLGYSYGTFLGAVYAETYPENIGHMVLDAPVNIDPKIDILQQEGFDNSLHVYAKWCVANKCELGSTPDAVIKNITGFWDHLDSQPIAVGDRELTQSLAVMGVAAALYWGEQGYETLTAGIMRAEAGNGELLLRLADILSDRNQEGHYEPQFYSFPAISCLDGDLDGKRETVEGQWKQWAKDEKRAPIFGKYFGPNMICAVWPVPPRHYTFNKLPKQILVIAATDDPATPFKGGEAMARILGARFLKVENAEHGSYGSVPCVNRIVVKYLTTGELPAEGTVCKP